ncbi:MAG: ACT domain-containing protein [Candidatus Kapaibacterium sp.]|nr:MAG: ACT domain-containing protein [Candidatus Kapabacteria bacterium]
MPETQIPPAIEPHREERAPEEIMQQESITEESMQASNDEALKVQALQEMEAQQAAARAATLSFQILPETFAILRLPPQIVRGMPEFIFQSSFYTISRSPDEVSIVCEERLVVRHIDTHGLGNIAKINSNWRLLRLGVMDLSLTGIAARFAGVLADNDVNVNIIATYDTDYVMIPQSKFARAVKALRRAGYTVE